MSEMHRKGLSDLQREVLSLVGGSNNITMLEAHRVLAGRLRGTGKNISLGEVQSIFGTLSRLGNNRGLELITSVPMGVGFKVTAKGANVLKNCAAEGGVGMEFDTPQGRPRGNGDDLMAVNNLF